MRFTCCLDMGFNLTILKISPDVLHDITKENVQPDHISDAFVNKKRCMQL